MKVSVAPLMMRIVTTRGGDKPNHRVTIKLKRSIKLKWPTIDKLYKKAVSDGSQSDIAQKVSVWNPCSTTSCGIQRYIYCPFFEKFIERHEKTPDEYIDYIKDDIDDNAVRIQLLQLCAGLKDEESHVLQAIVELIPNLYDCNMKNISESHLSSSFIHPFVHGLFSSKRFSKVAHW
ncbi:hypothetical protein G6F42_019056 [Rhizopus arrhizus]|nr:hypothetical protein G6F42_019056 [Rhizopus arrhizus]